MLRFRSLQAWDPRPRGPRTANLVSSRCPRRHGTLFHHVLILEDRSNSSVLMRMACDFNHFVIFSLLCNQMVPNPHFIWLNILVLSKMTCCPHEDKLSSWGHANMSSSSGTITIHYPCPCPHCFESPCPRPLGLMDCPRPKPGSVFCYL